MIKGKPIFFNSKKAEENPEPKKIIIWILIAALVIIIWLLVNGMIRKILTLY